MIATADRKKTQSSGGLIVATGLALLVKSIVTGSSQIPAVFGGKSAAHALCTPHGNSGETGSAVREPCSKPDVAGHPGRRLDFNLGHPIQLSADCRDMKRK